jgi:uncharacterized protein (DUF2235 family)
MPRNLVLCCDGTSNQFGPENTNVVRLVQVLDRNPVHQRLYYDPGVGTLPEPGTWTWLGKKLSEVPGLAFGYGLIDKVGEAYTYLMNIWEPGDKVFLFGFSRGAYTVRVLAGMLHALGLLPRGNENLVPYVLRLFKSLRTGQQSAYWKLCDEFRWTFARPPTSNRDDRRFGVDFLGVWDTVSSVGWVWDPVTFPFTAENPSIGVVRHAVSIDERRAFFRQNQMRPAPGQDFKEYWFPGVHGDIGGGYPEADGGLWRVAFGWMLDEAQKAGLQVNAQRLRTVLDRPPPSPRPWADQLHESLVGLWWLAEIVPKQRWRHGAPGGWPKPGFGRSRYIPDGSLIHQAALLRVRELGYTPRNFSKTFLEEVRGLQDVPETLPYHWRQDGAVS